MDIGDNVTVNRLEIGQRVRLRHDPQRRGVVRARAERANGGYRYQVALASGESVGDISPWYIEGDLEPLAAEEPRWLSRDEFLRELLLIKLRYPLTDTLYGYRQSRTDFLEYQYLPALKFLENPDHIILIADEVGLGKTIEACYIYRELSARMTLNGVLIVCPASLRNKWQRELKEKFDEDFELLNSAALQELIDTSDRSYYPHYFRAIVSYETLRAEKHSQRITDANFHPDLVIFDEAHHMRNSATNTHKIGAKIADPALATVLLSATPLQTGNDNLFHLFQLMKKEDFEEFHEFERMIAPNRHVIQAARLLGAGQVRDALLHLRNVERETQYDDFRGKPEYWSVCEELEALEDADLQEGENRQRLIRLQRDIHKLNTLSSIFQRTRKREVTYRTKEGVVIDPAMRRATSIEIAPDALERDLYRALMKDADADLERREVEHRGFARTTRERMAASCLPALRQQCLAGVAAEIFVERSVYDDQDWVESAGENGAHRRSEEGEFIEVKWSFSEPTRRLAEALGERDSKFEQLERLLTEILDEEADPRLGPSKILLFASYIGTLEYLDARLRSLFERRKLRYSVVHGGVSSRERLDIVESFRGERDFRLLLSSEVSSEGIDLQFCNTIINYDMPWNPMRIEQRIGRLDRYKQQNPIIRIYNFYLDIDIDARILRRLHDRIGLFEESIGDLEHILGPVMRELERALMDPNLSEQEKEQARERAEERIRHEREIQREYEEKEAELLSPEQALRSEIEDAQVSGRVIHPEEVRATLQSYLQAECLESQLEPYADTGQYILNPGPRLYERLNNFRTEQRRQGNVMPELSEGLNKALQDERACFITFDNEIAQERPSFEFINYLHPLLQLARAHWEREYRGIPALQGLEIEAKVKCEHEGFYFLFVMDETGVRSRRDLAPIVVAADGSCFPEAAGSVLGQVHSQARWVEQSLDLSGWASARDRAFIWMDEQRDRQFITSQQRNDALLRARESAIRRSFSAKIERRRDWLLEATEENIRRMRQGEIRNLQLEQDERLRQLMGKREVSVSYELVASGRVRLMPIESGSADPALAEVATLEETPKEKPKAKPTTISQRRKQRRKRKQRKRERRQAARP